MNIAKRRTILLAGILGLGLISAGLLAGETKVFSHAQHAEEGAECDMCHKVVDGAELPKLSPEGCAECHDDGTPAHRLPAVGKRPKLAFPHKLHTDAAECKDCHSATLSGSQKADASLMEQGRCAACHKENDVEVAPGACAACHGEDVSKQAPADHKKTWGRRHGQEARWRVFHDHGSDCALCHRNDGCVNCHKSRRPKSHSALWRTRTHGLQAAWDRQACKTCHETGACIRCHKTTKPLNHKGAWQAVHGLAAHSKSDTHCATCHQLSWCAACHAGQ
jgi:c(7)-type cytochrome triheme protein